MKDEEEEKEDHEVQPNEDVEEDDDDEQEQAQKWIPGTYQHVQRSPPSNTVSSSAILAPRQRAAEYGSFVERSVQAGIHEPSSILRSKRILKGEIVKVRSGRIARSRGRKDRHSKISTSKGTRDRRLRLSAGTAIQFFDVQDRLGYDRPSKAIDWLMEKAKAAINALANSPRQNQDASSINSSQQSEKDLGKRRLNFQHQSELGIMMGSSCGYDRQNQLHMNDIPTNSLSLVSESATTPSSSIQLQDYPPKLKQDICLSLQSVKKPVLDAPHHASPINFAEEAVNSASFLSDSPAEIGWFQPHRDWNFDTGHGEELEEFVFNSLPQLPQPVISQNQFSSQRGLLQYSSSLVSVSACTNPPISVDCHYHRSVLSSRSFASLGSARGRSFSMPQTPARIVGEEQEHGASERPSSISSV
ncbi:hypothetical protein I3760_10G055600 [Carya illinoinensis]|nr:hypothetical protein I3760_10G055600 [Carya illinoinensis]